MTPIRRERLYYLYFVFLSVASCLRDDDLGDVEDKKAQFWNWYRETSTLQNADAASFRTFQESKTVLVTIRDVGSSPWGAQPPLGRCVAKQYGFDFLPCL